MLSASAFKPRKQNSGRQHDGKRFPAHLAWLRKRPCIIADKHACEGKIEAAHVDDAGGKGMSLKVADFHTVPMCGLAHRQLHQWGQGTWQRKFRIILSAAAALYAKASPHRHLWETPRG